MKIFTAAQIRACDAYTIQAAGINSVELMERAATRCAEWIAGNLSRETLFVVLCGTGNNGGDGLALARILHHRGYGIKAFILRLTQEFSPDCHANYKRLQKSDPELVGIVEPDTFITDIHPQIVIIDAILGTGTNRPAEGWLAAFIQHINQLPNRKIAIDMPSGLPADTIHDGDQAIVRAGDTLSFQFHKRAFLHPESGPYAGNIHVLDIGLDNIFINATHTQYYTVEHADAVALYKPRSPFTHKGTYGNVLVAGGSYGKAGAIILTAKAALRSGAGLVTALVPACAYTPLQASVPEAMCLTSGDREIDNITGWEQMKAVGIGPGLGTATATASAFAEFLDACKIPLVVDADALNLLAKHTELLAKLPKGSILTPHPKEFTRLFGENSNSIMQLDHARIQAMRYNINIVLKGHHTIVVTAEGECWYNMTGNAGMATGGSGDVLTGIITGLLAQGYEPHHAAIFGVYIHGLAGDMAAKEMSEEALIAGDMIGYLGQAFKTIAG
ncbi:MAG: NAD(P)H-hydrate dehydratase [Bacteroidota bacterium]